MNKVGEKIRKHRKSAGLSADELAEKIGRTGVNRNQYIYDLEKGKIKRVDFPILAKFSNIFNIPLEDLIEEDSKEYVRNERINIKNENGSFKEKYYTLLEEHNILKNKYIAILENSRNPIS